MMLRPSLTLRSAIALFLLCIVVYALSASKEASGYADSDEFIVTGYFFSVAHPSGYGLLVIALGIWQRLVQLVLNPAHASNIFASLLMASAIAMLFYATTLLHKLLKLKINFFLLISSALMIAFSGIIWLYASVIEVASMSFFLTSIMMVSIFKWLETKGSLKWFDRSWAIAGVALGFVQTNLFLLPGLATFLYFNKHLLTKKTNLIRGIIIFIFTATLSAASIIPLNATKAPISWYFDHSISGWLGHVARQDYAGNFTEQNVERGAFELKLGPQFITGQPVFLNYLYQLLGPVLWIIALVGMLTTWRHQPRGITVPLYISFFTAGILLAGRLTMPPRDPNDLEYILKVGILHRQYIHAIAIIGIFASLGIGKVMSMLPTIPYRRLLLMFLAMLAPVFQLIYFFDMGYNNHPQPIAAYGRNLLDHAKPNSLIVCSGDIPCFSLFYASAVEKYRPDVEVLTKSNTYRRHYLNQNPQLYQGIYQENPYFYTHLIAESSLKKPTYITTPTDFYIDYIGFNGDPLYLNPSGYLFEVTRELPDPNTRDYQYDATKAIITNINHESDYFSRGIGDFFSSVHTTLGQIHTLNKNPDKAKKMFEYALSLRPTSSLAYAGALLATQGVVDDGYINQLDMSTIQNSINEATMSGDLEAGYELLRKASIYEPKNIDYRIQTANILYTAQYYREATNELLQALIYEPQNQEVKSRLQNLKTLEPITNEVNLPR